MPYTSEPGGIRTHDLRIKSPLLYRLSYELANIDRRGEVLPQFRIAEVTFPSVIMMLLTRLIVAYVRIARNPLPISCGFETLWKRTATAAVGEGTAIG